MDGGGLFSLRNKALGGSKRIKISRACDECRKRKVKCDGVQPCGRCRKSNAECVFAKLPPKRGPPKQYMENLENRLQRVEKALKSMAAPVKRIFEDASATEKKKQTIQTQSQSQQRHLHDIHHIPEVFPNHTIKKQSVSYAAPYTSDMTFSHIDRFTVNEIGQAIYVNDSKTRIDRIPNENNNNEPVQYNDTLSDIASISDSPQSSPASFYQHVPTIITTHVIERPIPDHLVSSRSIIAEIIPLTEVYFDHVHKYVPMIHKPTFLKQLHSATSPPSRFLLFAMCAVASRWSPDYIASSNNHTIPPGYMYYQRALDLLDDFIDAPRLSTVQALILLVKYQEYFQRNGFFHRSQMYLGMAVRMSMDLGLTQLQGDSYEIETKRRTFWVTFIYDLLMSIEQGRTTYFDVHQCTTGFPLVTGEEGPALEELITNQSIMIQLGKVLSDVYAMTRRITLRRQAQGNHRAKDQAIEEQARLFSLHTHLENFLYEVPPSLVYGPTQDVENYPVEKQTIADPFIGFLHMTYHFSVILLHRIYVQNPPPKTEFDFITYPHRQLCASSASNITGIVETLLESYPKHTFNYPTRGVQHTIHCLAMAATIHKYEMSVEDSTKQAIARQQYMSTVDMIQKLSNQSPSVEFSKYYNSAPNDVYMTMSMMEKSKMRRNTLSAATEPTLYQSSATITDPAQLASLLSQPQEYQTCFNTQWPSTDEYQFQQRLRLQQQQQQQQQQYQMQMTNWSQPLTSQQPPTYYNTMSYTDPIIQQQKYLSVVPSQPQLPYQEQQQTSNRTRRHTFSNPPLQDQYYPPGIIQQDGKYTNNLMVHDATNVQPQDTIMVDQSTVSTPHYDPTSGMSQLFLTDDQQVNWEESIISDTSCIQRSEGHVMK